MTSLQRFTLLTHQGVFSNDDGKAEDNALIVDSRFFIFALFVSLTTAKIKIERRKSFRKSFT